MCIPGAHECSASLIASCIDIVASCSSTDNTDIFVPRYEHVDVRASAHGRASSGSQGGHRLHSRGAYRQDPCLWGCWSVTGCQPTLRQLLIVFLGLGAMTEWKDIVQLVVDEFGLTRSTADPDCTHDA